MVSVEFLVAFLVARRRCGRNRGLPCCCAAAGLLLLLLLLWLFVWETAAAAARSISI